MCVCELVALFDVSQPTLSHHLRRLREVGLIDVERRGLWAFYCVLMLSRAISSALPPIVAAA